MQTPAAWGTEGGEARRGAVGWEAGRLGVSVGRPRWPDSAGPAQELGFTPAQGTEQEEDAVRQAR